MQTKTIIENAAKYGEAYRQNGFVVAAEPVIPAELIRRVHTAFDEVMAGVYETGVAPLDSWWNRETDDTHRKLRKIDQPHLANRTIREFITHPAFGEAIAQITGARFVQAWVVQLLNKPPGGDAQGTVGWHQDQQYWTNWWTTDSEVFTAWIAASDVPEESGPVCFVPGSQRWGLLNAGDFFATALDAQIGEQIKIPDGESWTEVAATMPAGAFSLHHKLTFHGSRPNVSGKVRRSFAVHLRTDKSTATPGRGLNATDAHDYDYVSFLDDENICPTLFEA